MTRENPGMSLPDPAFEQQVDIWASHTNPDIIPLAQEVLSREVDRQEMLLSREYRSPSVMGNLCMTAGGLMTLGGVVETSPKAIACGTIVLLTGLVRNRHAANEGDRRFRERSRLIGRMMDGIQALEQRKT